MGFPTHLVYLIQNLMSNKKHECDGTIGTQNHLALGEVSDRGAYCPKICSAYIQRWWCVKQKLGYLGISVEGRLLANLCYADDTALCANNHHEADELINQVNVAGTRRLLKLNVKKTKLLVINDSEDPLLWVRGEPIKMVINFKYLG